VGLKPSSGGCRSLTCRRAKPDIHPVQPGVGEELFFGTCDVDVRCNERPGMLISGWETSSRTRRISSLRINSMNQPPVVGLRMIAPAKPSSNRVPAGSRSWQASSGLQPGRRLAGCHREGGRRTCGVKAGGDCTRGTVIYNACTCSGTHICAFRAGRASILQFGPTWTWSCRSVSDLFGKRQEWPPIFRLNTLIALIAPWLRRPRMIGPSPESIAVSHVYLCERLYPAIVSGE